MIASEFQSPKNVSHLAEHCYILGAGAIGLLWAANLLSSKSEAKPQITLIRRSRLTAEFHFTYCPLPEIAQTTDSTDNIAVLTSNHRQCQIPSISFEQLTQNPPTQVTKLIIATKAYDVVEAFKSVLPLLAANAKVLILSNGIGYHNALQDLAQHSEYKVSLLYGVTSDGARLNESILTQTGIGKTFIGSLTHTKNGINTSQTFSLPEDFQLHIEYVNDVTEQVWRKFFINCAINLLTVRFNCNNGELLKNIMYNKSLKLLVSEIQSIVDAIAKQTLPSFCELSIGSIEQFDVYQACAKVIKQTSANTSSTLVDWRNKKSTELPSLNLQLIQLASALGIDCPVNRQLINTIQVNPSGSDGKAT